MRPAQLEEVLYWHAQRRQPVIALSAPGKGKSTIFRKVFKRVGMDHHTMNLALSDGTDNRGLPNFVDVEYERKAGKQLRKEMVKAVQWVKERHFLRSTPFIVFIDEIFQGMTQVQNAVAPLILESRLDDIELPAGSWVCGASNRAQDKAGTNRTPSHIPNRATIIEEFDTSVDDWAHYMLDGGSSQEINGEYQDPIPMPKERDYRAVQYVRMAGAKGLNDFDPNRLVNATERQWEWVATWLPEMPRTLRYDIVAGRVGKGQAAALNSFIDIADKLPTKERILLEPKKTPVPDEPSALYLVTGMLAHEASVANFDAICTYMKRVPPEFQAMLIKDAMRQHPEITTTRAFVDWGVQFAEVLS